MIHLADVSHHQGTVDWTAYARWSPAAICKATEGGSYVDPMFTRNQQQMRASLAVRGYYHFHKPGIPIQTQAALFCATVGRLLPGEFAALDVEDPAGRGTLTSEVEAWCATVDATIGGRAWVYSYGSYLDAHLPGLYRLNRPVWIASYTAQQPNRPMQLWQHTGGGDRYTHPVPGVRGPCDCSIAASVAAIPTVPIPTPTPTPGADVQPAALIKTATDPAIYKTGDGIVAKRVNNVPALQAEEAAGLVESHVRIVAPSVIADLHII